jgi:hypothetical protein
MKVTSLYPEDTKTTFSNSFDSDAIVSYVLEKLLTIYLVASSTSLPYIDLCFMASITLFSLEEAAKQLDTIVENHFQN